MRRAAAETANCAICAGAALELGSRRAAGNTLALPHNGGLKLLPPDDGFVVVYPGPNGPYGLTECYH
jgi:hypothetical protein